MFTSLAAVSIDKYQWYQYQGKKTLSFENHNPKYDLDLAPKMKYGIRTYAGKLKLAVLADPSIVFTMTEAEVKKIIRLSTGYSGRVKGVSLKAGIGGKDVKTGERVHNPDAGLPEKFFPSIPMPPKKQDIARLYNYFNKLHFKNECPTQVRFLLSEASKFSGQAMLKMKGGQLNYTLKLAKHALTDIPRVCEVVLHEMIHLLHYKRFYEDGNALYNQAGHGPLFLEDMHRLNKHGYKIDTKEYDLTEATLASPEPTMLLELEGDKYLVLHSSKDFKKNIPDLLEELRYRIDVKMSFISYKYGTTTSSYAFEGLKLTARNAISKNRRLLLFPKRHVESLVKNMTIKDEGDLTPVRGDIRPEIKGAIDAATVIIDQNLNRFMHGILSFARISGHADGNAMLRALDIARDKLSQAEYQAAEKKWASIEDRHLLKSDHFKMLRKEMLLRKLDGEEAIQWLSKGYDKNAYEGRIEYQRYVDLCLEAFGDIIVMTDKAIEKGLIEALHKRWD